MIKSTLKKIQKSIFFNAIAAISYIELTISSLTIIFTHINEILDPNMSYSFSNFLAFSFLFLVFSSIYAIIIVIACVIAGIVEIKQANTNGYIINIPEKILNSLAYKIVFYLGFILTIIMCIYRISLNLFII
ncbi:TPA: hypothetical protein CPT80_00345 [Candidatus Gastranaerophilales bacterium HUM_9]|nr:MAG TPA: hypothetical protein CPT80_00345 [Candidatus Gastranaerophilales bacterium HUM_9]HBX35494.1 hypothetical protein [Cyanobacteria bacterium UBA11440]